MHHFHIIFCQTRWFTVCVTVHNKQMATFSLHYSKSHWNDLSSNRHQSVWMKNPDVLCHVRVSFYRAFLATCAISINLKCHSLSFVLPWSAAIGGITQVGHYLQCTISLAEVERVEGRDCSEWTRVSLWGLGLCRRSLFYMLRPLFLAKRRDILEVKRLKEWEKEVCCKNNLCFYLLSEGNQLEMYVPLKSHRY